MHMRFFPPESIGDYAGVGAVPYSGPAIPSHVIEQLKSDPPAKKLDDGKVSGNVYENATLGFRLRAAEGLALRNRSGDHACGGAQP